MSRLFSGSKSVTIEHESKARYPGKGRGEILRIADRQADWRMRAIQQGEDLSNTKLLFTCPVEEIACLNLDLFWTKKNLKDVSALLPKTPRWKRFYGCAFSSQPFLHCKHETFINTYFY
ncbi:MAG: hypothetical protein JNM39_14140 [Bdellovibrionaceae bacterium]|nr:hypothetical protein [Pseudobdellovibrionaceae bacterium]